MSIITDFFIASPKDIENLTSETLYQGFELLQAKNVDWVKITSLEQIVLGSDFDETLGKIKNSMVREFSEEGPWICSLNPALLKGLAALSTDQTQQYALEWSKTEEWQRDRASSDDLRDLLLNLVKLSTQALTQGKQLFLYIAV